MMGLFALCFCIAPFQGLAATTLQNKGFTWLRIFFPRFVFQGFGMEMRTIGLFPKLAFRYGVPWQVAAFGGHFGVERCCWGNFAQGKRPSLPRNDGVVCPVLLHCAFSGLGCNYLTK